MDQHGSAWISWAGPLPSASWVAANAVSQIYTLAQIGMMFVGGAASMTGFTAPALIKEPSENSTKVGGAASTGGVTADLISFDLI